MQDQRVVVTGASEGIGRETARLLASRGAHVIAVARTESALKELAAGMPGVTPFVADLTVDEDRAALVEAAGVVDVLVNNAGVGWSGLVEDMPADKVRQVFELNVLALIDLTQRVMPGMISRRRGSIVNVSSVAGYVSTPPLTVYSASKFAVHGFSEGLRRELLGRGVDVIEINPGPVNTRFLARSSQEVLDTDTPAPVLGVPASLVAGAILRAVTRGSVPGYDQVAVPRIAGLSRLGQLTPLRQVIDASTVAVRPFLRSRPQ